MSTAQPGVDIDAVTNWLVEHVDGVRPPIIAELIAGGRSNLTFCLTDAAGQRLVLRRPPLGSVLHTAHDMGREHRIVSALATTDVPVAATFGLCDDRDVNGAPFYLMEMIDGFVLGGRADGLAYPQASRVAAAASLIESLAALHRLDPDAVGLGDFGRKEDYLARQLHRWQKQFHASKTRELPLVDELHARLVAAAPPQRYTGIVHGDYRLGNVIVGERGDVRAVLDWELATLGDTLADLGWLLSYWTEAGETGRTPEDAPSAAPGFPTRSELINRYEAATGRDLTDLPYYVAFARWRLACIGEGVVGRYRNGAMGDDNADVDGLARTVVENLDAAAAELL